ncbi:chromosome segregation protein SMC [Alkaliphilus serpentinus]|uniref:Chromosome partition protein Smc n=1 Tax=Alkaliphilus serpentinus TaxID=1482731 RepID=A0A833MEJ2_9FIRM|nr:chromosome segregation protein SMC [Alkaliphilus serpentinus]KAB3531414.1 chromosome segregation protein SMC [Alkaliphilus serpentinus]
MYLKRLEIQGFKSFADKIEMQYENGITGVVGPNGSGKSNISDSIRWVLGEQSPKSLRGSKMEDVIFAGTASRRPVGMAEVSITLDNASRKMPIDYGEITITRRVYRSGESEYYLNKSACRLKDIRELLMDTGIGKEGYSIIGQGKIDEILSSKAEDRRLIFEEAAGIIKYKTRRDEAEKKLTSTKDNLLRVADILHELENQLEPLRRQSVKAKKYQELKGKLLTLEVNLFIREIDKIEVELNNINNQLKKVTESLEEGRLEKQRHAEGIENIKQQLNQWDIEYSQLQGAFHQTENEMKQKEGDLQLFKEKLSNNDENVKRLKDEIRQAEENHQEVKFQLEEKLILLEEICQQLNELQRGLTIKLEDYEAKAIKNSEKEREMEDSKSYIIDTLNRISDKKSELNSLKTLLQTMEDRLLQVEGENDTNIQKLRENQDEIVILDDEHRQLSEEMKLILHQEETHKEELKTLDDEITEGYKGLEALKNKMNHLQSRKNVLEEMEKEHEGFNKSVKNILQACKENPSLGRGVHGVVADLIKVPKGYETAIEIALGPAIQNIVCDKDEEAKRLILHMKNKNLGRITILPINTIQSRSITSDELSIIDQLSNVKIAFDIVDIDPKFKKIFSSLLSRVLVVPNIEAGVEAAKKLNYRFKIVTLDGDVLNIGGSLTGGSSIKNTSGILGRKRELEDLLEDINLAANSYNKKNQEVHTLKDNREFISENLSGLNLRRQDARIKEATLINQIQQAKKEKDSLEGVNKQLLAEIIQLKKVKEESYSKLQLREKEIQELEVKISNTKDSINSIHDLLQLEKTKLEELNSEITGEKVKVASIEGKKQSILQEIEYLQQTIQKNEGTILNKQMEVVDTNQRFIDLTHQLKSSEQQLEMLTQRASILDQQLNEKKDKKNTILEAEAKIHSEITSFEEDLAKLQEDFHKLELKRTKLDMQQQSYYNRLWEEYELTYQSAVEMKIEIEDISQSNKDIKNYKDEIKALGSVNIDSIEEYDRVKERFEFLRKQQEDLLQAQDSLNEIIKDMEKTMEKQFTQQFQIIKENFNTVFTKLFGGGRADLVLEEEGNVLKSGVEIIAQPPGKKLQNLSLLSGGERALTAISLLFAILLVKPSPFCILDEIEAALDDSNVHRFAAFLKELSETTQFIIVTHRKGTMEIADVLYGVTMEEEGVSKLVSVKLMDQEEDEMAS